LPPVLKDGTCSFPPVFSHLFPLFSSPGFSLVVPEQYSHWDMGTAGLLESQPWGSPRTCSANFNPFSEFSCSLYLPVAMTVNTHPERACPVSLRSLVVSFSRFSHFSCRCFAKRLLLLLPVPGSLSETVGFISDPLRVPAHVRTTLPFAFGFAFDNCLRGPFSPLLVGSVLTMVRFYLPESVRGC